MACDALQLGADDADVLSAQGDFDASELFDRAHVCQIVRHAGYVVHAVGEGYYLYVCAPLGELFGAAMQISEYGLDIDDYFTVECDAQPEHPVRAGMLWA